MKIIAHDDNKCRACRTCEIACSWHHHRVFSPGLSDIQVTRNNQTGEILWTLDTSSCDLCKDEEKHLCIKYCLYKALTLKEVS